MTTHHAARHSVRTVHILAVLLVAALALSVAPASQAQQRDCFWAVADDPNALNVAYPDEGANYWGGGFLLLPGTEVRLTGELPYARYASFNLYSPQLSPIDALADVQLVLDEPAAPNPFEIGADRQSTPRTYTVRIISAAPPEDPAEREPNTLYANLQGQASPEFIVMYRLYLPDDGRDQTGDVGLPEMSVTTADGNGLEQQAACDFLATDAPPTINDLQADNDLGDPPAPAGSASDVLKWRRFFNLPRSQAESNTGGTPLAPIRGVVPATNNGGYLSNVHNTYGATLADRSHGPVLVLEGRAPTVPPTIAGNTAMADGDLRYWSLCENERQSTRFLGCVYDEEAVLTAGSSMTTVVSTPEDRPDNATAECGVNWIPWGAQPESLLILRHMLPNPTFVQTVFNVDEPYTIDAVVGEYLPRGNHLPSAAEFEERGCPASHDQGSFDGNPSTVEQVDGDTPQALSIAVSRERFGGNAAGRVVLARADAFADALAGSPLTLDAPLLLTSPDGLDPAVRVELDRVADSTARVYVLGGTAALAPAVEQELVDAGYDVVRLAGDTRIATSVAIAEEVRALYPVPESTTVLLARAFGPADGSNPTSAWADAVTAGGFAAAYHTPVLLTASEELSPEAAAALESLAPERTLLIGGEAALSPVVADAVPDAERIGGTDRAGTAAALVAEWGIPRGRVVLTDGHGVDGWVAGLLAAGLAADGGAPQLLLDGTEVPAATRGVEGFCAADVLLVGSVSATNVTAPRRCG